MAVSWRNTQVAAAPPPWPWSSRIRLWLSICLAGCALHLAGAAWAVASLTHAPSPAVPVWLSVSAAWLVGTMVDPWLATDILVRARGLGASGDVMDGLIVGLSLPPGAALLVAWQHQGRVAAMHALPGLLGAVAVALLIA